MRMYRVIHDASSDVTDAMKGMLAPKFREVALGGTRSPPGLQDQQRGHRCEVPRDQR